MTGTTPDDEDGVSISPLAPAGSARDAVSDAAGGGRSALDRLQRRRRLGRPTEQIAANRPACRNGGTTFITSTSRPVPSRRHTYARFRLSSAGGLGVTGAATDGEVEDYAVTLR